MKKSQDCTITAQTVEAIFVRLTALARCMRSLQSTANACARAACKHLNISACPQSKVKFGVPSRTVITRVFCRATDRQVLDFVAHVDDLIAACRRTTFLTQQFVEATCRVLNCKGSFAGQSALSPPASPPLTPPASPPLLPPASPPSGNGGGGGANGSPPRVDDFAPPPVPVGFGDVFRGIPSVLTDSGYVQQGQGVLASAPSNFPRTSAMMAAGEGEISIEEVN